ncbi:MAG: J domain-containing protein [Actinomycetota bacterium]|nr:J domain-containing protein [Actinomycetota bacterium]
MTRHPQSDPYAILGVTPEATSAEITRAYRRLLRSHHPDTHQAIPPDPRKLTALLDAYRLLRDPHRRTVYDREHTPRPTPTRPLRRASTPPDLRAGPVHWHPVPTPGPEA